MVRVLFFVSVLLSCCSVHAQIQSGLEYDVYFLAGQSNASGRGDATQIPAGSVLASPQTDVQFYWRKTLVSPDNGQLTQDTFIPLQVGSGHGFNTPGPQPVEFGPELSMGRTLADLFPSRNIVIVKYSHGGSNLHTQWAAGGVRYADFISTVNDALADITAAGATYQLRGTAWVQGEADAGNATNAANYQANVTDLIARIRADVFSNADAPFVISRLSDNQYSSVVGNVGTVRTGQVQAANALENVEWVDADAAAFSTFSNGMIHFDANGTTNLGNALGQELGTLVTGSDQTPQNPDGPVIYSINAGTSFGNNGANAGMAGPTFVDNMDGTFTLANGTDSGANNAVYIDSSDGGSVSTLLGRGLTLEDVVTVSGTITFADINYNANGVEFGLQSAPGFRAQPNLLFQIDADGVRGGFAPFFGTPNPGENINQAQTPGVVEASLNDGYSFEARYTTTDIVFTVTDIITNNETGAEPVAASSLTFSLSEAAAADPSLASVLDDYVANSGALIGNSFAYFSHQNSGGANSSTFSNFEITVTSEAVLVGDVNCDGAVDFLDISPFISILSSGGFSDKADIDRSGVVDFLDIAPFITLLSS